MTAMFISVFPILIATVCMLFKKDTTLSLLIGTTIGIEIFFVTNGLSVSNIRYVLNVIYITIYDNASVLFSILLLIILVYLITESSAITTVNLLIDNNINTPIKAIIALLVFGVIFSLDDYLLCIATATILTDAFSKQNFSKEKITYLINLTSVSCCCLSPFSSWMPVIKRTLSIAGLDESNIYRILPYNFTALLGIVFVIMVGIFKPFAFMKKAHCTTTKTVSNKSNFNPTHISQLLALCFVLVTLLGSLIVMTFIFPCSYAVIRSALLSILVTLPIFIKVGAIKKDAIVPCLKKAFASSFDLYTLLLPIWLLSNVCKYLLHMDKNVSILTNMITLPIIYLPVIIYIVSGAFAFLTGSSYGTFGLFIPLAAQLTTNASNNLQLLTIAASISGSLMSAYSFTSDTLNITADKTKPDFKYLYFSQLPYGLSIYLLSILNFLLAGISVPYGEKYTLFLPLIIQIYCCICIFIIRPFIYNTLYKILTVTILDLVLKVPYNYKQPKTDMALLRHKTCYSLYSNTEKNIQINIKKAINSNYSRQQHLYYLKMPGL